MLPDRPGELAPRSYWSHVDGFLEVMLGRSEPGESTHTNVVSLLSSYLMSVSAFISKIKDEKSTMKTSVAQLQEEKKKTRRKKIQDAFATSPTSRLAAGPGRRRICAGIPGG